MVVGDKKFGVVSHIVIGGLGFCFVFKEKRTLTAFCAFPETDSWIFLFLSFSH
jgi:hypothetical protein